MKKIIYSIKQGFTLVETLVAVLIVALVLTAFIVVFAPAAAGIRKSLDVQEANRIASTLEQELASLRPNAGSADMKTGFQQAFDMIKRSNESGEAILIYQYRASLANRRQDQTPVPVPRVDSKEVGKDYMVQTMVRRYSDPYFKEDLTALEGNVFYVKCNQLVFNDDEMVQSTSKGAIVNPKNSSQEIASAYDYPEALIAFSAEFYMASSRAESYFLNKFTKDFASARKPIFIRNLSVRR
jgi:prepilin-type N-terminal cleavage/methylation domain-containing protein